MDSLDDAMKREPGRSAPEAVDTVTEDRDRLGVAPLGRKRKAKSGYSDVARAAVFWTYLRSAIYTVAVIPTTVILARLLSPSDFGIAAAATFFGQLAVRLSS